MVGGAFVGLNDVDHDVRNTEDMRSDVKHYSI
jgi:hypothetical protein